MNEIQKEAQELLAAIDQGWNEGMFESIDDAAGDDQEMAELVGMIRHHMNGTDEVRSSVKNRLALLAGENQ